jgi:hypothetical protein
MPASSTPESETWARPPLLSLATCGPSTTGLQVGGDFSKAARKAQRQRIEGRTAAEDLQQFEQAAPGAHGGVAEVFIALDRSLQAAHGVQLLPGGRTWLRLPGERPAAVAAPAPGAVGAVFREFRVQQAPPVPFRTHRAP